MSERFYGKFPATVVDNNDKKGLGRITVKVPEVFGDETTGWCLPSMPYVGVKAGLVAIPDLNALVFVEWPGGDTTRTPIWSGGYWADGDGVPGAGPKSFLIVTPAGHQVLIQDDGDQPIVIQAVSGAKATLDKNGVQLEYQKAVIKMTSSSISFNNGNLEVKV
jgi:Type VI secretion system/phage-baseplate injector OB domain